MPWGTILSVAAPIVGGIISGNASKSAADAQAQAAAQAAQEQAREYNQTRDDQAPWRQAGSDAVTRLAALMQPGGDLSRRFSSSDLANDPVYNSGLQFGLDQGTGAINARALQGGSYDSGATLKALTKYANDYGSTKANESYNRFNTDQTNLYNRNAGIAGLGQSATNQTDAAGQNYANQVSNLDTGSGSARSAGIVGEANAYNNALTGLGNAYNNYNSNQLLKTYLTGTGTGNSNTGNAYYRPSDQLYYGD